MCEAAEVKFRRGSAKVSIPQTTAEFTPDWFNGIFGDEFSAKVLKVEYEGIGAGIGFLGELQRCTLTWDSEVGEADGCHRPESVVVKVPAAANSAVAETLNAFEREIVAYRDLSATMALPMPRFYYGELDPDPVGWGVPAATFLLDHLPLRIVNWMIQQLIKLSGGTGRRYVLVMEDIKDARPPTQAEGGTLDDALAALETLAVFHAAHWESEAPAQTVRDAGHANLIWPLAQTPKVWQAGYMRNRADFVARFGEKIGADKLAKLDALQPDIKSVTEGLMTPWTLLHGDYRLDNILFRADGELIVIDFQLLTSGSPAWDVAYFITTALTAEHVAEEERMLRVYHDALVAAGQTSYSFAQLQADAEISKLVFAHRCVCSFDTLETDRGAGEDSLTDLLVERVMGWVA